MNRTTLALVPLIVLGITLQSANGAEFLFGDVTALRPINTSGNDHAHLSADGLSLYVTSGPGLGPPFSGGGNKSLSVFRRGNESDPWGPREDLGEDVNGGGSTGVPSLTQDELSLFYSDTIAHWGPIRPDGFGGGDIWVTTRASVDSPWKESVNLEEVNSRYLDADASISADGLSLFFTSTRPGGSGNQDIWTSNRAGLQSTWETPQNLGPVVNSSGVERTPSISPDGLTLFFAQTPSQRPDLWATSRIDVNSPWQEPVHLGTDLNSSFAEIAPQLSADGSTFYFSRWGAEFDTFSVPVLPFETVPLQPGSEGYSQGFGGLGVNGKARGTILPTGWTVSDNETVFSNATDLAFPVGSSLGSGGNPILNAGAEGDGDRTLAIGAKDGVEGGMIQLLADVVGHDATAIQLQFDLEVWDARSNSGTDDPGQGAFLVHVDIDRGEGYEKLADLGTVKTGLLATPTDAYLDKNAAENRVSFNSGQIDGSIPAGSKLRVHWHVDQDAQTNNWVFGLDNVNLTLFDTSVAVDIDALSAVVRAGTNDPQFDLNGDGFVDDADRTTWVQDIAGTFFGDADLNKEVDFADFLALSNAFGADGGWAQGDFDGNGNVDFPDFLALSANFGASNASAAAVPEPTGICLAMFGILGLIGFRRRQ